MGLPEGIHTSEDVLERYGMGQLSEDENAVVEEHLLICAECRHRVSEFAEFLITFRTVAPALEAEGRARRSWTEVLDRLWRMMQMPAPLAAAAFGALCLLTTPVWRSPEPVRSLQIVELHPLRAAEQAGVLSGGPLRIRINLQGLDPHAVYRAEIANNRGIVVRKSQEAKLSESAAELSLNEGLLAGQYWVRVYPESSAQLVREFGLVVR